MVRLQPGFAALLLPNHPTVDDLDRLIAAATAAHLQARRALALAVAEEEREASRHEILADRAADLEGRALEALAAGRDDLAERAAEAIATLETEVTASRVASSRFTEKVAAARREVDEQRRRLAALDRGRRLSKVGRALAATFDGNGLPLINRAEAALLALDTLQADDEAVHREFSNQGAAAGPLIEAMATAGFGRPTRTRAADVLARLRARAGSLQAPTGAPA